MSVCLAGRNTSGGCVGWARGVVRVSSIIQFAEFDQLMHSDPTHLRSLVDKVQRWLVCKKWRKVIYGTISVLKCKLNLLAHYHNVYYMYTVCYWNSYSIRSMGYKLPESKGAIYWGQGFYWGNGAITIIYPDSGNPQCKALGPKLVMGMVWVT